MSALLFWSSVALVAYAYIGYPCVLMLLARFRSRPVADGAITPRVSFVISAHNEERRIVEKLQNTIAQNYPAELMEIIVASDCSTDRTDELAIRHSPRIRVVRAPERRGKEAAQQLAIAGATGEIFVFSDVATALRPDAVTTIVRNFADPTIGCVSSVDCFVDESGQVSGEGLYVRYEMWLRSLESRVGSLVGLSGSFFAARRSVCSGWRPDRQSDFNTLLDAVALGLRGVLDPKSAGFYRNIVDNRREFERKVRTVVRGLAVVEGRPRMLNPWRYGLFAWQLASHKVCRWLVPFGMIGAFTGNALLVSHSNVYAAMFSAQSLLYLLAVGGLVIGSPRLRVPAFFLLANLSVFVAWLRFASGQRITTWNPSDRLAALPETGSGQAV